MQTTPEPNPNVGESKSLPAWITLAALFAVALIARLYNLGHPAASTDELQFIKLTEPPLTIFDIFREHYRQFLHTGQPPAAAMLQSAALWLLRPFSGVEAGIFWLRLPSALWSALAIIPLARLGTLVAGRTVGTMTGLMAALFFFPVYIGRDACYDAAFVLFTALALHGWLSIAARGTPPVPLRDKIFSTVALCAMTTAHASGIHVALALIVLGFAWVIRPPKHLPRRAVWNLILIALLGALASLPFYWQKLTIETPASPAQNLAILGILRDVIGKQFFGTHALPLAFAGLLVIAGISTAILWKDSRRHLRLGLLAILFLVGIILAATSVPYALRPFSAINGLLYLTAAIGIFHTLNQLHKRGGAAALALTALLALAGTVTFFPPLHALPAKGVNYAGIARVLVANLPPGSPYVMESGYDIRYTPGLFPTPGLLAACPYLHGDVQELWARQQRFFERFPTAAYVESAHHGAAPGDTTGIFEWPRRHFRQKIDLTNEPLARLARLGIWPHTTDETAALLQSQTSIYYNTPSDTDAIALASGTNAVPDYTGWTIREIQQFQYAYFSNTNTTGTITIRNLTTEYISGELELPIALVAPAAAPYQLEILQEDYVVGTLTHTGGKFQTMNTGVMRYKPGPNAITIRITQGDLASLRAIVIPGVIFRPR